MIIISASLLSLLLASILIMRNLANGVIKNEQRNSDQTPNFQSLFHHDTHEFSEFHDSPDLVTPKLAAPPCYPLSIQAPPPPKASYDAAAARCGEVLFYRTDGK